MIFEALEQQWQSTAHLTYIPAESEEEAWVLARRMYVGYGGHLKLREVPKEEILKKYNKVLEESLVLTMKKLIDGKNIQKEEKTN